MFGTIKEKMAVVINTFWNSADNKYLLADWKSILSKIEKKTLINKLFPEENILNQK